MSDMITAEAAGKLLDDLRKPWTIAENMQPLLLQAADALEALHAQLAVAKAAQAMVIKPSEPGAYNGDIYYGDPVKTTMGTHRWESGEWVRLPTETETILGLLAAARKERDEAIADRDRLAAANTALEAKVARLVGAGERLSEQAAHVLLGAEIGKFDITGAAKNLLEPLEAWAAAFAKL